MANKYSSNDLNKKVEGSSRWVDVKPCSPVDSLRSSAATEHGMRDSTPVYVAARMFAEPTHPSEVSERAMKEYQLRLDLAAFFLAEQAISSIDEDLVLRECGPRVDTMTCSMGDQNISSKVSEQGESDHSTCVNGMNQFLEEHKILSGRVELFVIDLLLQIIWKAVLFSEEGSFSAVLTGQSVSPNKTFGHNIQNDTFLRPSPETTFQDNSLTSDKEWVDSKFEHTPVLRNWVSVENIAEVHNNTKIDKPINDLQNLEVNSWSQSNLDVKCSRKSLPDTEVEVLSFSDEKINKIAVENSSTFSQESNDDNGDQEGLGKRNNVKIGVPKMYERENSTSALCEPPINIQSEIKHVGSTGKSDVVKYFCDIFPQPCVQLPKKMLDYSIETLPLNDGIFQNLQHTIDGDDARVKLSVWENSQNQYQKGVAETYAQGSEPSINWGNTSLTNRLLDPHLISLEDQYKINSRIKGLVSSTKDKPKIESNLVKTYKITLQNKQEPILSSKDNDQLPEKSVLSTQKLKMEEIKEKTNLSYKIYNLEFLENNEITPNSMKKSNDNVYYPESKIYSIHGDINGKDKVEGLIFPILSVKNDIPGQEMDNMSSYKDFTLPSTDNMCIKEKCLSKTSTKRDTRFYHPLYCCDSVCIVENENKVPPMPDYKDYFSPFEINNAMTSSNDDEEDSEVEVQIIEPTYNDSADESDTEFESYRNEKTLFIKDRRKELWTCAGLLVEDQSDPFSLSQDIFEFNSLDHISDASFEDVHTGSADNELDQKISNSNEYKSELYEMSINKNHKGENYLEKIKKETKYSLCNVETISEQMKLSKEDTCDISCERMSLENKDIPGMHKLSPLECGENAYRVLNNEKSDKQEENKSEKKQKKSIKRNCKFGMRIRKLFSQAFGRQSRDKAQKP